MQNSQSPSRPSTSWLTTAIAYAFSVALIAGTIFFSVDETRMLIG